jgi:hypothetical protein
VLTPQQREIAQIIAGLDEAFDFGLAGGAALIVHREIERSTRDLDFFGPHPANVEALVPAAEQALTTAGFQVDRIRQGDGFVRLEVKRDNEITEVDIAADARLFPLEVDEGLPVLSRTELAVDKVLAVFGRAEPRDFVDLAALAEHFELAALFRLAAEKDPGFSLEVFAEMLDRFGRLRREEFGLTPSSFQVLQSRIAHLREHTLELAPTLGRELGRDFGRGL